MRVASVNLIPRRRLTALRVRVRARVWCGIGAVYVAALASVYAGLHGAVGSDAHDVQAQLERMATDMSGADAELKQSRAQLAAAVRLLGSVQELRGHPDWSALLQAISAMRGDDVVLGSLELKPEMEKADEPLVSRPSRYALRLTGLARDHRAATSFSLELEKTGVFSHVRLTDTSAQTIGEKVVVAFGVECAMDETGGEAP
jgi:hypothetical protein